MNTKSQPPGIRPSQGCTASRISRRVRLRTIAPPKRRLAAIPTRTWSRSLARAPNTSQRLAQECPDARTRRKSLLRRSRFARGIPTPVLNVPVYFFDVARRNSEATTPPSSPSFEHPASIASAHPGAKPMHPRPPSFFRLIGSFGRHAAQKPPARRLRAHQGIIPQSAPPVKFRPGTNTRPRVRYGHPEHAAFHQSARAPGQSGQCCG